MPGFKPRAAGCEVRTLSIVLRGPPKFTKLFSGGSWYRFVMTGDVTGGKLKTPADADSESLQAKWIADLGELSLRANDVIPLVERGRQFAMRRTEEIWHAPQVGGKSGHPSLAIGPLRDILHFC